MALRPLSLTVLRFARTGKLITDPPEDLLSTARIASASYKTGVREVRARVRAGVRSFKLGVREVRVRVRVRVRPRVRSFKVGVRDGTV